MVSLPAGPAHNSTAGGIHIKHKMQRGREAGRKVCGVFEGAGAGADDQPASRACTGTQKHWARVRFRTLSCVVRFHA